MTTTRHRVGFNVRAELARAGKTQAWVAELLGISQQSVSKRLLGQIAFDVDEIDQLSEALGVAVGDLMSSTPALRSTA